MLKRFGRSRAGNVAMMFGLLLVPMVLGVGVGIDLSRSWFLRNMLTEAADAAVLAAARAKLGNPDLTDAEATKIARKYFEVNAKNLSEVSVKDFDFNHSEADELFSITAITAMPTTFMSIVGMKSVPIDVYSEANAEPSGPLEAALVLDTTGSMDGSKLSTLKTAANAMADALLGDDNSIAKISVIPFSQYVNVGTSRRYETWIDVPADYNDVSQSCQTTYPNRTKSNCQTTQSTCTRTVSSNCRQVTSTCTEVDDGEVETYSCTKTVCDNNTESYSCSVENCDVDDGAPVQVCTPRTTEYRFHGCVGSRNNPFDTRDSDYQAQRIPGLMNLTCGTELLPLTADANVVKGKINSLTANGTTYIPAGLAWGIRALSSHEPLSEGEDFASLGRNPGVKAIILMTDGANTSSPDYPTHKGSDSALANTRTEELCKVAKDADIQMFTVAFEVSDNTIKNLLEACATTPEQYFDASSAQKLKEAFREIGIYLQEISLTR